VTDTFFSSSFPFHIMRFSPDRFLLGDCFMAADEEFVTEKLEGMKDEKQKEMDDLEAKLEEIKDRQRVLKDELYERFGNSINLDA